MKWCHAALERDGKKKNRYHRPIMMFLCVVIVITGAGLMGSN